MKSITINLRARKSSKVSTGIHFKNIGLVKIYRLAREYLKQQIFYELHSGTQAEIEVNQYQDIEKLLYRGLQMIMDRSGMEPRSGYRHISLLLAYLMGRCGLARNIVIVSEKCGLELVISLVVMTHYGNVEIVST